MSDVGDRLPGYDSATGDPVSPSRGWQPIETAPKDGSLFMVHNGKDYGVCRWLVEDWVPDGFFYHEWASDDLGYDQEYLGPDATHWMPLPPPPVSA